MAKLTLLVSVTDGKKEKAWSFFCPGCKEYHRFIEGRWKFNGDMEKPTFRPSLITPHGKTFCHLTLKVGKIKFLPDCKHELAGQTVNMEDDE